MSYNLCSGTCFCYWRSFVSIGIGEAKVQFCGEEWKLIPLCPEMLFYGTLI